MLNVMIAQDSTLMGDSTVKLPAVLSTHSCPTRKRTKKNETRSKITSITKRRKDEISDRISEMVMENLILPKGRDDDGSCRS